MSFQPYAPNTPLHPYPAVLNLPSQPYASPKKVYPIFPRGCHGLWQVASYSKDEYISLLAKQQRRSKEEVETSFADIGGVEGFLGLARQHKEQNDYARNNRNTFFAGEGPRPDEALSFVQFPTEWNLLLRIYGFERLAGTELFAFDFVDSKYRHVDTPKGMTITSAGYLAGTQIYPIRLCMASTVDSELRDSILNAPEEQFGLETYMIEHGTPIQIQYKGASYRVHIPQHIKPAIGLDNVAGVLTATLPRIV